jgi:hypothetical protein
VDAENLRGKNMNTTTPSPQPGAVRELLIVAVPALLVAGILIAMSHLWDENKALRALLADEMRKSAQESESNSNYLYLFDKYPGAKRMNAYTTTTLDVPTNLQHPTTVTLGVDWGGQGKCSLTAEAIGLLSSAEVLLKPRLISCGAQETRVDGLVFGGQAR